MTTAELAAAAAEEYYPYRHLHPLLKQIARGKYYAFTEGAQFVLDHHRWRPVSEGLPTEEDAVQMGAGKVIEVLRWDTEFKCWSENKIGWDYDYVKDCEYWRTPLEYPQQKTINENFDELRDAFKDYPLSPLGDDDETPQQKEDNV